MLYRMSANELEALGLTSKLDRLRLEQSSSYQNDDDNSGEYMNTHSNSVPIGPNFQAQLPPLTSSRTFLNRVSKQAHIQTIKALRIHDPRTDP